MPVGIVGAILVSAVLYVLMCLCICLMLPSSAIDLEAPFAAAFTSLATPGSSALHRTLLATSARFVSFGALTGHCCALAPLQYHWPKVEHKPSRCASLSMPACLSQGPAPKRLSFDGGLEAWRQRDCWACRYCDVTAGVDPGAGTHLRCAGPRWPLAALLGADSSNQEHARQRDPAHRRLLRCLALPP